MAPAIALIRTGLLAEHPVVRDGRLNAGCTAQ
jgi:hypothetical protein